MKKIFFLLITIISLISCSSDDETTLIGNWKRVSQLKVARRAAASTFVIGNIGYIVGGYQDETKTLFYSDLNSFDPSTSTPVWEKKAAFPGTPRKSAVAFSIGTKGYYGTGIDENYNYLMDFWEYDSEANTWKQIGNVGTEGRKEAIGFGLNGKGYLLTGADESNALNDTWELDPATGTWTELDGTNAYPGSKRQGALTFTIDNIAYVCTGNDGGSGYKSDFYSFNGSTWTYLHPIANVASDNDSYDDSYAIVRQYGSAFVIDSKAYVTCGNVPALSTDTWQYDPKSDRWERKTYFEATARTKASSFTINNRGFILTGVASSTYLDDVMEFQPNKEVNEDDNTEVTGK